MIKFIKVLPYELHPSHIDEFSYVVGLLKQTIDPPSLSPAKLIIAGGTVFHSPLRRACECLHVQSGAICKSLEALGEVPFDVETPGSRERWLRDKSRFVRNIFKEAFINDTLLKPRGQLLAEVREVLERCLAVSEAEAVTVVSHSFRLKVIEAFVKTAGRLAQEPKLIQDYILDEHKTYDFGEQFTFKRESIVQSLLSP